MNKKTNKKKKKKKILNVITRPGYLCLMRAQFPFINSIEEKNGKAVIPTPSIGSVCVTAEGEKVGEGLGRGAAWYTGLLDVVIPIF